MSSIVLSTDALKTTPSVGEIEQNGKIFTATPQANTQRGIVPTEQFFRLNSSLTGANATGAQNIFGVGVTLAGSTVYEFEIFFLMSKSAGTTSHTISVGYGGTATINNISWVITSTPDNISFSNLNTNLLQASTSSAFIVNTGANTTANLFYRAIIQGSVSINAGGTFIPQYSLSAAPGGAYSTIAGSYMKIKPIGSSGSNTVVGTWS